MCGISGVFEKQNDLKGSRSVVLHLNEVQKKRGPNDEGIDSLGGVVFGHRRLSIIDLSSAGHQPMRKNELLITFNGEIYNFQELKKDLIEQGVQFHTETDTEVILALFEREGEAAFQKLRGMFAFGLWDDKNKAFYLVRDEFGIKPLYYAENSNQYVFASSVKAIVESNNSSLTKNEDAKIGFLLFGSIPSPQKTYKEIQSVPAGSFLKINNEGKKIITRFLQPLNSFLPPFINNIADTQKILKDSVEKHLISDAPIGVFLSGGLDSSLLAALATDVLKKPIQTVSVSFQEEEYSEKKYQQLVANKIGSKHTDVCVTKKDFLENLPDALSAMDQPTIDGINSYFVSHAAKKAGLTVVLSGLGADELFCGYPNFHHVKFMRFLQSIPFSHVISSFTSGKYTKLAFLKASSILGFYLVFRGVHTPREIAEILQIPESKVFEYIKKLEEGVFGKDKNTLLKMDAVQLFSYLEMTLYMQNQLLKDTDFMSMHHSLEVRVPFVDKEVVRFAGGLSPKTKLGDGKINKPVLVSVAEKYLPREIFDRKKMGFTFPFEEWLREAGKIQKSEHWSRLWAKKILERF
jgi:asparagine synthase (glutamine-hydrolysing)